MASPVARTSRAPRIALFLGRHKTPASGLWVYARNMARALYEISRADARPFDFSFWLAGADDCVGELRRELPPAAQAHIHHIGANWPSRRLGLVSDLWLRIPDADLVHGLCNTVPLRAGPPALITLHDLFQAFPAAVSPSLYAHARSLWYRITIGRFLKRVQRVFVVHPQVALHLSQAYPGCPQPILSFSGLDRAFIEAPLPGQAAAGNYLLMFASRDPRKNLARSITAMKILLQRQDIALKVVANSEDTAGWVREHIDPTWARRMEILRGVPADAMPSLYRHARGVVFASCAEGFGFPLYEALSQGVAVVAPAELMVDRVREPSRSLVFACDPFSQESIVRSCADLLAACIDPAARLKAAICVRECMDARRIARDLLSVYAEVLGV